jgi:hypothetical protein
VRISDQAALDAALDELVPTLRERRSPILLEATVEND